MSINVKSIQAVSPENVRVHKPELVNLSAYLDTYKGSVRIVPLNSGGYAFTAKPSKGVNSLEEKAINALLALQQRN